MIEWSELTQAVSRASKLSPIPVRKPSYNAPPFWGLPLNISRVRPIEGNSGWITFFTIPKKELFVRIVQSFVLDGFTSNVLQFRFILNNHILAPNSFVLTPNIERHIERFNTHPYPCTSRKTHIFAKADDQLLVQVNNTNGNQQYAYGAVYGWYYPNTRNPNEISPEEGMDDQVRGIGENPIGNM